jgi:hypothetical protein
MIATTASSAAFDVVLIVHVLVAVISVIVLAAAYVAAASLGRVEPSSPWPEGARRFFTPGPDIAGRIVYLVPISGFALVGLSQGEFDLSEAFIGIGMLLSVVTIVAGEWLVFPATSRLGETVAGSSSEPAPSSWKSDLARLRWGVDVMVLAVVISAVVMVAKP